MVLVKQPEGSNRPRVKAGALRPAIRICVSVVSLSAAGRSASQEMIENCFDKILGHWQPKCDRRKHCERRVLASGYHGRMLCLFISECGELFIF